ncbi:MAG: hypothetical protein KIT22_05540 [Verrucomicrobiae bacterium]|nr:hypothetical protein [Verrucomicrobiae bacterium]
MSVVKGWPSDASSVKPKLAWVVGPFEIQPEGPEPGAEAGWSRKKPSERNDFSQKALSLVEQAIGPKLKEQ